MLTVGREKLVKYVGLRVYETSKQSVRWIRTMDRMIVHSVRDRDIH